MEGSNSSPIPPGITNPPPAEAVASKAGAWTNWALGELLRCCLPALLVAVGLRVALTVTMPYGYVQYDSSDYLVTAQRLIEDHKLHIHTKRSYLTPFLFTAAFALPIPATITIAAAQHFMGLLAILVVGAIVRLWFRSWRTWIIPITLLFGANPFLIWYEHTIMGEAQFLFFTLLMVLAGTWFARERTPKTFFWFILSLVAVFGTRLEAKTYLLFSVALVTLALWKVWKRAIVGVAIVVVVYAVAFNVGGDRDVSSLVYASLIRFAPGESPSTPDIMPQIREIQAKALAESPDYPSNLVRISKYVNNAVDDYAAAHFQKRRDQQAEESRIVRNLCLETLKAEPVKTLLIPWVKFQLATDAWSGYCFDSRSLWENQVENYTMKEWMNTILGRGLTGATLTKEQLLPWLQAHYRPERVQWFTDYEHAWNHAFIALRLPDRPMTSKRWVHDYYGEFRDWEHVFPGMPIFFILGFAGMVAAGFWPAGLRAVHWAWVPTVLGGLYVCSMVGVTNGRFRFVYEPFFLLYLFFLFDTLLGAVKRSKPAE